MIAIGKEIAMACFRNPTKLNGRDTLAPRLQQMLDGWTSEDPPTVPQLLVELGLKKKKPELTKGTGAFVIVAFYYLLHVKEIQL